MHRPTDNRPSLGNRLSNQSSNPNAHAVHHPENKSTTKSFVEKENLKQSFHQDVSRNS